MTDGGVGVGVAELEFDSVEDADDDDDVVGLPLARVLVAFKTKKPLMIFEGQNRRLKIYHCEAMLKW